MCRSQHQSMLVPKSVPVPTVFMAVPSMCWLPVRAGVRCLPLSRVTVIALWVLVTPVPVLTGTQYTSMSLMSVLGILTIAEYHFGY